MIFLLISIGVSSLIYVGTKTRNSPTKIPWKNLATKNTTTCRICITPTKAIPIIEYTKLKFLFNNQVTFELRAAWSISIEASQRQCQTATRQSGTPWTRVWLRCHRRLVLSCPRPRLLCRLCCSRSRWSRGRWGWWLRGVWGFCGCWREVVRGWKG